MKLFLYFYLVVFNILIFFAVFVKIFGVRVLIQINDIRIMWMGVDNNIIFLNFLGD